MKTQDQTSYEVQPIVKEKEVIREVVKIRCSYCGNLYDENQEVSILRREPVDYSPSKCAIGVFIWL